MKNDRAPTRLRLLAPPGSLLERSLTTARGRGPSEAELRALGAAVLGASPGGIAAAAKTGSASLGRAGLAKATMVLAVAGTVAGTAGVAWHHRPPRPSTGQELSMQASAPMVEPHPGTDVVPLTPAPRAERSAFHVERRRAPASPSASRPQSAVPVFELPSWTVLPAQKPTDADEELRLVGAAQRALPHDPAQALALAREHARRFPDGALAQERDAVAVSALWETGHRDEARERARRFVEAHPGSTYVGRMREILRPLESPEP